jgi:hypothetical protein
MWNQRVARRLELDIGDLLGFAMDGVSHSVLLSSIRTSGPDVISGGDFGLEGGLACTVVFLIAIGIIAVQTGRSAAIRRTAPATGRSPIHSAYQLSGRVVDIRRLSDGLRRILATYVDDETLLKT